MNNLPQTRTLTNASLCLLVCLASLTGCWNSHPKQDADHPAASDAKTADSPPPEKTAVAPLAPKSTDDALGFQHTWKPKPREPKPAVAAVADAQHAPATGAARPPSDDNRYGEASPAPKVGNPADVGDTPAYGPAGAEPKPPVAEHKPEKFALERPTSFKPPPQVATDPPGNPPLTSPPSKIDPASAPQTPADFPPSGNPLRAHDGPSGLRPLDPASSQQPVPAPAGSAPVATPPSVTAPPVAAPPSLATTPDKPSPSTAPGPSPLPLPGQGSEIVIQTKPEETITEPAPLKPDASATPAGPLLPPPAAPAGPPLPTAVAPAVSATPAAPVTPSAPAAPAAVKKPEPREHGPEAVGPGPRTNKNSGVPFNPEKENGKFFVGWPKPKLALVITGNQEGYLEPCGCAGLERMKGGMSRRYAFFRQLREKEGWPVVGMDVGNIAKGFGKQAELKFQIAVNAMSEMKYNAVTLGPTDLHLPAAEVMALTMPAGPKNKTMFVCGNVGLFEFNEALLPRTQLISAGFKTIGLTAVLGKTYSAQFTNNNDLKITSPERLLDQAVPLLKPRSNYLVLLAQTTREEAIGLAKMYPALDLIVCADGNAEPPAQAEEISKGGTKLIEVGEKGMYAVVIGMFDDPKEPFRYQRVTLDSRYPSSPEMIALMAAYQGQLKDLGLSGLGIRPLPNPYKATFGDYAGTDSCKNCHEESYRVWKKTPHSRAFATLLKAVPPRNFDPECVSCHTVGWNPSKFFPYQSGYLSEKETPHLINVGCENCHGPGQKHVDAENRGTAAQQAFYRKAYVITKEEMADPNSHKQNCWACHDLDNSPEFKFDLYWPYVKHYEHE